MKKKIDTITYISITVKYEIFGYKKMAIEENKKIK